MAQTDQNGQELKKGDKVVYQTGGARPKLVLAEVLGDTYYWNPKVRLKRISVSYPRVEHGRLLKVSE